MHIGTTFAALASITLVAAAVTISGCQSGGGRSSTVVTRGIQALTGEWDLSKLAGVDVSTLLPHDLRPPSLNFGDDGRVSGFAGVNRLSSSLDLGQLAEGRFALAPAAVTKMAGPPKAMELEDRFLAALTKATGYSVTGNRLTLTDKATELMEFVRR